MQLRGHKPVHWVTTKEKFYHKVSAHSSFFSNFGVCTTAIPKIIEYFICGKSFDTNPKLASTIKTIYNIASNKSYYRYKGTLKADKNGEEQLA